VFGSLLPADFMQTVQQARTITQPAVDSLFRVQAITREAASHGILIQIQGVVGSAQLAQLAPHSH
jgi:hypothetical protein